MKVTPVAGLFLALSILSVSAQRKPRVTGFFSDMQYIKEAGDVIGTEVWIVYGEGRYYATVQLAEGQPMVPQVVPAVISESSIEFSLPLPSFNQDGAPAKPEVLRFRGVVSATSLTGTLGEMKVALKRRTTYWQ